MVEKFLLSFYCTSDLSFFTSEENFSVYLIIIRSGPKKSSLLYNTYTINDLDIMFFSKNDYFLYQLTYFDVKRLSKA